MEGILFQFISLAIGLGLLMYGSNLLIQSCVKLSFLFKLTPLFIGVIVLAFGTSAPELAVGIIAAVRNEQLIALGDVIGSNIANIGLVLGLSSLAIPLDVHNRGIFKKELPMMLLSVAMLYLLSLDSILSRIDGAIFIALFILFSIISYRGASADPNSLEELKDFRLSRIFRTIESRWITGLITLVSLLVVLGGAQLMVRAGVRIAEHFGIAPWLIAITVFAVGTSLPELAASVTAAYKKIPSISIGNVIGSNVFNIFLVLGVVSIIQPIVIERSMLGFEFPVLAVFSVFVFVALRSSYRLSRNEGLLMVAGYVLFLAFLIARS